MKTVVRYSAFIFSSIILITTGCRVAAPSPMPTLQAVPDSFPSVAGKDSSIASTSWRQFFADIHLNSLIDTALVNNQDLLSAMQRVEIARAQLALRRGALQPSVNLMLSGGGERYGDYTMNGVGNFDTNLSPNINSKQKIPTSFTPDLFLGFRSEWELDIWGKLKNEKKAAIANLLATEKGRQYAVTSLVAEIATRYYQLLSLDTELRILKKNIALQQQATETVKVLKEGGRATELAVQQFEAQLLNTKALQYSTIYQITATENELNALTGRYPRKIARDTSIMHQHLPAALVTGLPTEMITRRPDIRQAELQLEAAQISVVAARKSFMPSLKISPYLGLNAFNPALLFNAGSVVYGALGGLTTPLFSQQKLRAGLSIANAENKQAFFNYQKVLLSSFSEVSTVLSSLQNTQLTYDLKQQEVDKLSAAVTTARDLYLTGYASYLEVITAQKGVLEAELQLTENKKLLFTGAINLYRSLGGGWN